MPDIIKKMQCSVSYYLEHVDKNTQPLSSFSYFSLCDFPQLSFYLQIDHIRANQCSSVFQRLDWGSDTWSETLQKKTFRLCRLAGARRGNVPLQGWLALGVFPRGLAPWRFTQHCLTEPGLAGRITFHSRLKSLEIPCSSKDTETKEATHGLAEVKSVLLAILPSFIFYLPKLDQSQ